MDAATQVTGLLSFVIGTAVQVIQLTKLAQRNKEKCSVLKEHVENICLLLTELKKQWTPDPVTGRVLQNLKDALDEGKDLVESCQKKRTWSRVFKTQKKAKKFDALGVRISNILATFHVANMVLIVSINKESFFMNVLKKLLRNGACRRLPSNEKEELRSSIKNLTNMDNMSSDAKMVLENIVSDLTDRDDASSAWSTASSATPAGGNRGVAASSTANDVVVRLALSIVQEAKALRQNRQEIQQLLQFVQQIANLMQQPQSCMLSEDHETKPMVDTLTGHLQDAYKIVLHNQQHRNNTRIAQTFLCGVDGAYFWQQPDQILKVAYKIEYYVQVLPVIAMRQMYA